MNRPDYARMGRETLQILEGGAYKSPGGRLMSIKDEIRFAVENTIHYTPEMLERVSSEADSIISRRRERVKTVFEVRNESTLDGAFRLIRSEGCNDLVCLNFASGKRPGGGFLGGATAQEESLARSSGLYSCIARMRDMYRANKRCRSCLYTDNMIYSPKVPVFRKHTGELLDEPYGISIITAPAPNAGAVRNNETKNIDKIPAVARSRAEKILSLTVVHEHTTLLLGAWGCGAFRNDPSDMAEAFRELLRHGGKFAGVFATVVFSILDNSRERRIISAFEARFVAG